MKIDTSIQPISSFVHKIEKENNGQGKSFGEILDNQLNKINDLQIHANNLTQQMITGEVKDLHTVMLATEESRLSLEMAVQIRNKIVEAYQEISRMQL